LYKGTSPTGVYITQYTAYAPNSGSYTLTLGSYLATGSYYITLRTVENGIKIVFYGAFTIK
jgi:hypothetical protein